MSENAKNDNQEPLRDLLRRSGEGDLQDDFEREAAEGFRALDPGEIYSLKDRTDAKVSALLERSTRRTGTWAMAAGVALVIGLSIFFLRDDIFPSDEISLSHRQINAQYSDPRSAPPQDPSAPVFTLQEIEKEPGKAVAAKPQTAASSRAAGAGGNVSDSRMEAAADVTEGAEVKAADAEAPAMAEAGPAKEEALSAPPPAVEREAVTAPVAASQGRTEPAAKKKMTRAPAPAQAEFAASGAASTTDPIEPLLQAHFREHLPAGLRTVFVASFEIDRKGRLSNAVLQHRGTLSEEQAVKLVSLINEMRVETIGKADLVSDKRSVLLHFRP